jgi:hypothetical protein
MAPPFFNEKNDILNALFFERVLQIKKKISFDGSSKCKILLCTKRGNLHCGCFLLDSTTTPYVWMQFGKDFTTQT